MTDENSVSRRGVLAGTLAAAAGGAALLAQTGALGQAPTPRTRKRFKAWISRGDGPGRTTLQDVTLRPIAGRQVAVRTEATNLCCSNVPAVLGIQPPPNARPSALAAAPGNRRLNDMAVIQGHGGIGTVEAADRNFEAPCSAGSGARNSHCVKAASGSRAESASPPGFAAGFQRANGPDGRFSPHRAQHRPRLAREHEPLDTIESEQRRLRRRSRPE